MVRSLAAAPLLALLAGAGCGAGTPAGEADDELDGAPGFADAAPGPDASAAPDAAGPTIDGAPARTWPRTADALRAALGGRGRWSAAWQLDEDAAPALDDLGPSPLLATGAITYGLPGAWADDRAIAFAGRDGALTATVAPFELDRGRSLAALFALRIDGGGVIAGRVAGDGGGGALLLAADPATGELSATLADDAGSATATLAIDHRDARFHDVLVVVDRVAGVMRVQSDLGGGERASIAALGDVRPAAPFALGAAGGAPAASARVAFAAIATADVGGLVDGDDALRALRLATERAAPIVRPPAAMPWTPPWPIRRDRRGAYTIDVDPRALRLPTTADLWLSPAGDDAAPGTAAAPRRSLHAALASITAPTTIHLAAGTYDDDAGWWGVTPAHDVNLIAEGGRARITLADAELGWQPSADGPGVFAARYVPAPYAVIDGRTPGADPWLRAATSAADVAATPGSWFAAGGVVTVHTRDGAPPDARLQVMPAARLNARIDDPARSVYLEGLDLEGGYKALHVTRARRVIVVDTSFRYGASEGLSVLSTEEVLAFGAVAEANQRDGLAYSYTPRVLEVDCTGRDNGRGGANIDNGSTVHSGGAVVRIGGFYRDNRGPNVADVGGARSWNLGTRAGGTGATSSSQRVNFYIDGELWLREGSALDDDAAATTDLVAGPGARLHAFDSRYASVGGTGTIDARAE
jgi:hypothetical protein